MTHPVLTRIAAEHDRPGPVVMGIVNVTPDSFSDGGRWIETDAAIAHGRELVADGATVVDVGGESTRPGARPVSPVEELERVAPVVEAIAAELAALSGLPFLTEPGDLLDGVAKAIRSVTGRETTPSTSGGTSDGRFIATLGTQVVELGPVNATIHQVDEHILASDLDLLTEIYYQTLVNLLAC